MIYALDPTTKSYSYTNAVSSSYSANLQSVKDAQKTVQTVTSRSNCCHCNQNEDSAQFLSQYQYQMKSLSGAANKLRSLNQDSLWHNFSAKSSDTSTADVYSEFDLRTKADYGINVLQLAQKQVSRTNGVAADGSGDVDGSFQLSLPNQNKTFSVNVETAGRTNRQVQADIAAKLNQAGLGLSASVVERDGSSYLQVESKTGKANAFEINGSSDFSTVQDAQNLKYTVSKDGSPLGGGMVYQNESNENVKIDGYKISADFKKTGSVNIGVGVDTEKIMKATEEFITQYNKTVEFLVQNAHRGTGTAKTLDNLMRAPISKDSMKTIGITMEENGTFSFDKEKFEKVLKNDSRKVYDILSDNYSIADGVYQDAQRGLSQSANSLISYDMQKAAHHHTSVITINYGRFSGFYNNAYQSPFFFDMRV